MRKTVPAALIIAAWLAVPCVALANGVGGKAKQVLDPDCTVKKAARGAVARSTIGVGNRCDAAETARDVTGLDGKNGDGNGPLKNRRK